MPYKYAYKSAKTLKHCNKIFIENEISQEIKCCMKVKKY